MRIWGSIADGEGGNYLLAVVRVATVSVMNTIPLYRRHAGWILVVVVILTAWAIDREQLRYRHMRAEMDLDQTYTKSAVDKLRAEALAHAQSVHERNRRAAMGLAE